MSLGQVFYPAGTPRPPRVSGEERFHSAVEDTEKVWPVKRGDKTLLLRDTRLPRTSATGVKCAGRG